jgi:hypothetical protein
VLCLYSYAGRVRPVLQTVAQRHKCSRSQHTPKYKIHVQAIIHQAIHPAAACHGQSGTHAINGLAGPGLETALADSYKAH